MKSIIKSRYWKLIVGLPFLFSLLPTINTMLSGKSSLVNELDVYYAVLTLIFLGFVLWHSFAKRRLLSLAFLSLACILVTLLAQFYKLTDLTINLTLFSAIFKTSLIMLFFALALSWVKELSESVIPSTSQLTISFAVLRQDDKIERTVLLGGFPGREVRKIRLTLSQYELFHRFASLRKSEGSDWLEIKPKHHALKEKKYDIGDYNEVRRLLFSMLDGLFGKGNWTKKLHLNPLKDSLFELSKKRERKIRLCLPPENINL